MNQAIAWDLRAAGVGSRVVVSEGGWSARRSLKRAVRVTKTCVFLDDGSRWTRRGRRWGSSWDSSHAALVLDLQAIQGELDRESAEARAEALRHKARAAVVDGWKRLTPEMASRILEMLGEGA